MPIGRRAGRTGGRRLRRGVRPAGRDDGTFFERLFGPYPFATYTVVVTDDELEIPLESQSPVDFGRNFAADDWDADRLVAHELAHQWFGNSRDPRELADIWLHEGFACYAEWLWSEAVGRRRRPHDGPRHHYDAARRSATRTCCSPTRART